MQSQGGNVRPELAPHVLREKLLNDIANGWLRRRYLTVRTDELAQKDLWRALLRHFVGYVSAGAVFAMVPFGSVFAVAGAMAGIPVGEMLYAAALLAMAFAALSGIIALRDAGQALAMGTLGPLPWRAYLLLDSGKARAAYLAEARSGPTSASTGAAAPDLAALLDELLPHAPEHRWFRAPMIPPRRLAQAIATYARRGRSERILALADGTCFGSGARGCLLTADALYFNTAGGCGRCEWRQIRKARIGRGLFVELALTNGRTERIACAFFDRVRPALSRLVDRLAPQGAADAAKARGDILPPASR